MPASVQAPRNFGSEPSRVIAKCMPLSILSSHRRSRVEILLVAIVTDFCAGFACGCNVHRLLLPASAECPVKLHETLVLRAARLRECEFRGKEGSLSVQDFEIRGGAPLVTHIGQAN